MESLNSATDLSVVIPSHNTEDTIEAVISTFLDLDLAVQVIVVDDRSSDDTPRILAELGTHPDVVALFHDHNQGAGVARNTGFAAARGRYTIFFDADDDLLPGALESGIPLLDETGADVAVYAYNQQRHEQPGLQPMNRIDRDIWSALVGDRPMKTTRLTQAPRLLGMSNYPWNKVVRTERFREVDLRFGTTPVHNDVLGHWQTLIGARTILAVNQEICTHVVGGTDRNLTNRHGAERLALFDALDETYAWLCTDPVSRQRYAHHYWDFALRVSQWALDRIAGDHRDAFHQRLRDHLHQIDIGDFSSIMRKRDPGLAASIVKAASA